MMETLDIDKDGNLVMEDFIRMRFLNDVIKLNAKSKQTYQKIFKKKIISLIYSFYHERIFLDQDKFDLKTSSSTATARCVIL